MLNATAKAIAEARDYTQIFPEASALRATYIKLVGIVHPDRYLGSNGDYQTATKAFQKLQQFYQDAHRALTENRYGEPVVTIRTKQHVHVVTHRLVGGDIADVMRTTTDGATPTLLKITRSARDNDLMAAEANALKSLHTDHALRRHFPALVDTFMYRDGRRRGNVIQRFDDIHSVEQLRGRYPDGMDPRHVVWIWRRLLMALGYAHDQGLIHGAVLPPHVLILPKDHGVVLADWCYSSRIPDRKSETSVLLKTEAAHHGHGNTEAVAAPPIKALVGTYRDWYPEEVLRKAAPTFATDLMMAARCMIHLTGGDAVTGAVPGAMPRQMRTFFKGCLAAKQSMRPDNARGLLKEFDRLLVRLGDPYYPRRFIELVVPTGATRKFEDGQN